MAKRFNEELMRKKGLECMTLLDESGLDLIEQYTVVKSILNTMKKTMVLYVVLGDEAEDVLKGEM